MSFSFFRTTHGHTHKGFTLVELAISMSVIGLITVSIVGLYATVVKREREVKTRKEMENIRDVVLGDYQNNLTLPSPDSGYLVPIGDLDLPFSAQTDEIYNGKYYAYIVTNNGSPFAELKVDGQSIGNTAVVLISSGTNLKFEENNVSLNDGEYTQKSSSPDFDDILIYISANELASSIAWRREIEEEVAVLNQAATILAENDDDGDGFVDEDPGESNCGLKDIPGNCDGVTNWNLVTGVQALVNAGLISNPDHLVDPWGKEYLWDSANHKFYSAGPNKTDEGCGGDDICP
jgi:prepilin-type N-terminal cleavage/methylation domain-containing protein